MKLSLLVRIGMCIMSGFGVGLVQIYLGDLDGLGGLLIFYGASGLLFAAGILFPYLNRDRAVNLSAFGLAAASAASYWCAVWLAVEIPIVDGNELLSFTVASVAGALIVMAALVVMTSIRMTGSLIAAVLFVGVVGGPMTNATLPKDGLLILLGHAGWHLLLCLAIYFGTRSYNARTRLAA